MTPSGGSKAGPFTIAATCSGGREDKSVDMIGIVVVVRDYNVDEVGIDLKITSLNVRIEDISKHMLNKAGVI